MDILKKKRVRRMLVFCLAVGLILSACCVYLGSYYRADTAQIEAFPAAEIAVSQTAEGYPVFVPENASAGFIFYPGGKVEHTAYIPLMESLASEGVLCVLVQMPGNLAVLDMDAAGGIPEQFPEIDAWYIGGHSLGGAMAASYLRDASEDFAGLVLLGAYSTADLSGSGLSVLSIYGSEDRVMNREKYDENLKNLPNNFTEVVIDGGCHAGFGMYGAQDGDGIPTISNREQILQTADATIALIRSHAE